MELLLQDSFIENVCSSEGSCCSVSQGRGAQCKDRAEDLRRGILTPVYILHRQL